MLEFYQLSINLYFPVLCQLKLFYSSDFHYFLLIDEVEGMNLDPFYKENESKSFVLIYNVPFLWNKAVIQLTEAVA